MCSTCVGRLGDAAGLRGLGFRLGKSVDVKVYWPDVLPGPAIVFALGLYDVAAQGGSLVDYESGDVLILCWGEKQYLLAWVEMLQLSGTMGSVEILFLALFLCQQEVVDSLHADGERRLAKVQEGPVVQDLPG